MKLTEKQVREMYADWILRDCSCQVEEIQYLFDNLPKDHKEQIALDMQEHHNN